MKNAFRLITRPYDEIERIAAEEPLFSGAFVFAFSVLAGNIELVLSFFIDWRTAVFNSFALVSLWGAALALGDALAAGIIRLIKPSTAGVTGSERFRKLFIVQLHLSLILLFRPVLSLFISAKLSWVLIFIWGATLVLIAAVRLWKIAEIKAVVALAAGAVLIFAGSDILTPRESYPLADDFDGLRSIAEAGVGDAGFPGFLKERDLAEKADLIPELEDFVLNDPDSTAAPYALLIIARLHGESGNLEAAEKIFRQLADSEKALPAIYLTAKMNLKRILTDEQYALIPDSPGASDWRPILNLWKIPRSFSVTGTEPGWADAIKRIIFSGDISDNRQKLDRLMENYRSSDFTDDIYYWLGERHRAEGDTDSALSYYEMSIESAGRSSRSRWEAEGTFEFIESLLGGSEILEEKYRVPHSLLAIGEIHRKNRGYDRASRIFERVARRYRNHRAAAEALLAAAEMAVDRGMLDEASGIYSRIGREYPETEFSGYASQMNNVIRQSETR